MLWDKRLFAKIEVLESRRLLSAGQVDVRWGAWDLPYYGTYVAPGSKTYKLPEGEFPFKEEYATSATLLAATNDGLMVSYVIPGGQQLIGFVPSNGILGVYGSSSAWGAGLATEPQSNEVIVDPSTGRFAVIDNSNLQSQQILMVSPDGTADSSFGTNGTLQVSTIDLNQPAIMGAFDAQGQLVLAAQISGSGDVRVERLTTSGALDTSFAGGGSMRVKLSEPSTLEGIGVASSGEVVLYSSTGGKDTITRIDSAGNKLGSVRFGQAKLGSGQTASTAFTVAPNGDAWLARTIGAASDDTQPVATQFLFSPADGSAITVAGSTTLVIPSQPTHLQATTDGYLLFGGQSFDSGSTDTFAIQRFAIAGGKATLDTGYGNGGTSSGNASNVVLGADGDAYVSSTSGSENLARIVIVHINGGADATPGTATLVGGVLTVTGTSHNDDILINKSTTKNTYVVHVNSFTKSFPLASIKSVNIIAGAGDDAVAVSSGVMGVNIDGGDGRDTLYGGDFRDTISGGLNPDYIDGNGANDLIQGGGGNDSIDGGPGNDQIYGNGGSDTLDGDDGNDSLYGGPGAADTIWGAEGNDSAANDPLDTYGGVENMWS